jgi:DNA invertase Pin-like site-specific DNA recombinase
MTEQRPCPRIGYLRVSTDEQGIGLEAQREQIRAYATARGWDEPEWQVDHGHSGKTLKRPAITQVLKRLDVTGGVLIVAKLDRLSRSTKDVLELLIRAGEHGWQLVAIDIGVDMSTAAGELIATMMAALAQWERRLTAERTVAALAALRSQGVRLGRQSAIPAEILARIVAEREAGRTIRAIADGLNDDQVPTARGGLAWRPSTISGALRTAALDREAEQLAAAHGASA